MVPCWKRADVLSNYAVFSFLLGVCVKILNCLVSGLKFTVSGLEF